jgi:hypothetical protein
VSVKTTPHYRGSTFQVKCIKSAQNATCQGCADTGVTCTFTRRTTSRKPYVCVSERYSHNRYGRPFTSEQHASGPTVPMQSTQGSSPATRAVNLGADIPMPAQAGPSSTPVAFGSLFDPSSWLPDSYPLQMVDTGSLMNMPSDSTSPVPAASNSDMCAEGISAEIDHIVKWPVVLAFLNIYHERL